MSDSGPASVETTAIVLADDHFVVRGALKALLEGQADFTVVGEAGDIASARAAVLELRPRVLVLDVNMPDGLAVDAVAAGLEPDRELSAAAVQGLTGEGLAARLARPRLLTRHDVERALRIIGLGCDVEAGTGQRVDRWDVPAIGDGYAAARDRIVANVERLVSELASER